MNNLIFNCLKTVYRLARKTGNPKLCLAIYRLAIRFEA